MPDIAKAFRIGSKKFLDFDTQMKLAQREQERKARQDQQDAMNENITRLALNLESPAGVAATRRILGGGFNPEQELNFRRLKSILPASLQAEQYDILNPLAAKAGFSGRFGLTPLSRAKVGTQLAQTETEQARTARTKELDRIAKENQKLREAESKARLSKINSDIKNNKALFIKEIGGLFDKVSQRNFSDADISKTVGNLDRLEKAYSDQLEDLKSLPDFPILNPDFDEDKEEIGENTRTLVNPKYDKQIQELSDLKKQTRNKKIQILSTIMGATGDAQKVDQATGGAVAGNAAESLRQKLAIQLLEQEFPQLAAQIKQEQAAAQPTTPTAPPKFMLPPSPRDESNRRIIQKVLSQPPAFEQPQRIVTTPDGKRWRKNTNGSYTQVK